MSNLKCPFCKKALEKGGINKKLYGCPECRNVANIELWREIKRTKRQLDLAKEALFHANEFLYGRHNVTGWDIQQELKHAHYIINKDTK